MEGAFFKSPGGLFQNAHSGFFPQRMRFDPLGDGESVRENTHVLKKCFRKLSSIFYV